MRTFTTTDHRTIDNAFKSLHARVPMHCTEIVDAGANWYTSGIVKKITSSKNDHGTEFYTVEIDQ